MFGNTHFYDKLDDLVKNYNSTIHSSIHAAPEKVHKAGRTNVLQQELITEKKNEWLAKERNYKELNIGDHVRVHILTDKLNRKNKLFAKKYLPQWSLEIYKVVRITGEEVKKKYKLKMIFDANKNRVNGPILQKELYRHDLQLISK